MRLVINIDPDIVEFLRRDHTPGYLYEAVAHGVPLSEVVANEYTPKWGVSNNNRQ